ncbi:GntR family transcriptional regulator [Nesterenkonia sp. E16_7]|uniref:GntR family transcriptional regulator n=1 Tax=unclassified Nesterenkonia TaxID=2629769 RepID=UPI001A90FA83|nr:MULTISPECIES: GntR family transcriptional regulator [unclassified Nesterenkonia]MBO0596889.1 GntR family transcriptional regulator [Nesterenkonia sp. E16_10]MBO0598157.1 GntR family transcriptional regulator [Nesterenkonia sp. E16_7]
MSVASGFQPVPRESTSALITRQLREGIMRGTLPAGAQLSEVSLAAEFGVSRGPLREAMQRLVQEGLVRSELNRGLFVKELDETEIRDLYLTRTAIETAAARAVAHGETVTESLERLRARARAMAEAAAAEDLQALADADFAFHEELVNLAGSPRLHRVHETLMVETRMCLTALQGTYFDPEDQVSEHTRIVEAIAAGDDAAMVREIEEHMQEALDRLVRAAR